MINSIHEPSPLQTTPTTEEDEWDTDGFVIPSLGIEEEEEPYQVQNRVDSPEVVDSKLSAVQAAKEENIYLGPHGAPPSQAKQQEHNTSNRKQKFKQRFKEADNRYSGTGCENKVDNLRELVGSGKTSAIALKSSTRDWLDPHCHESQFERKRLY